MSVTAKPILEFAIKNWASDIHITEWDYVAFRVNGHINKLESAGKLSSDKTKKMLFELMWENKETYKLFLAAKDLDFAHKDEESGISFRVNAFFKLGRIGIVMRQIAWKARDMSELGLPEWVEKFTKAKQGLILVTWPTGSWKSTSMVSILDKINEERKEHIITIEDPVEFIFEDKKSIFSQRELWRDTESFASSLKAAMREDPDIVMVWEMRDPKTVEAAMELAETGHLVISTMHTSGSVQTITRLVNFFPADVQNSVRYKLADILFWVLSQRLIPTPDRKWRRGIYELMFMTSWIKNLIRTWEFNQIANNIEMGSNEWMIAMKTYADRLADVWEINEEDYINFFQED